MNLKGVAWTIKMRFEKKSTAAQINAGGQELNRCP